MKQFRLDWRGGKPVFYDFRRAVSYFGAALPEKVCEMAVGESWVDRDGDTWTRLPDVGDEPQSADPARKERRERIATAALGALLTHPRYYRYPTEAGQEACKAADALIAALDAAE